MANKATKKSKKSQSSLASSASNMVSNQKVASGINSSKMTKRTSRRRSLVTSEKEGRPNSSRKLTVKQKKKHEKFDVKKPKKPPTAFFYFLEDFRKEFQEQNPNVKSMRDIGKACGEKWKTMTYEEKVKYYDIATEKRAEFDSAMADYIKKQESGEGEETEEDSEFDEYDA
ncbi:hypothetical protein LWI29_016828 [Acer saccharum]|uniref:HMG box domain-containing protein n=1 Tax=Acer saccharum TaxID=4024 RepID=A0AA39SVY7_ACESA|nr:hypothetical protein LWI29_016828 [Acer saccharum]